MSDYKMPLFSVQEANIHKKLKKGDIRYYFMYSKELKKRLIKAERERLK